MKKIKTILILFISLSAFAQESTKSRGILDNCDAAVQTAAIGGARHCSANGSWTVAVDVIVPADHNLTLNSITPSFGMSSGVTATSVRVTIYNNANGIPGSAIGSPQIIVPTSSAFKGSQFGMDFSEVLLELSPVELAGSAGSEIRYWVAMQLSTSNNSDGYIEHTSEMAIGSPLAFSSGVNFIIADASKEGVYSLNADCEPMSGNDFPAPYCGPLVFGTVEPITRVEVAGINNVSSAAINGSPAHEDFTSISGEMEQGNTYAITLEGNTAGDYVNQCVVFIDWNQNGILDDEGEVYVISNGLFDTTGTDGGSIVDNIEVPSDALLGSTRMRIKKTFEGPHLNPCDSGANWGQAEDYSIVVTESLGTNDNNALFGFSFYPNPSSDVIYLQSAKTIENISVYNLFGQKVSSNEVKASFFTLDISNLSQGAYMMRVAIEGEIGTYKVIKK